MAYGTESIPKVDRIVGPGQRVRHRGEAPGRGHRGHRRPRRPVGARDRGRRRRRHRHGRARPRRPGRARPRRPARSSSRPTPTSRIGWPRRSTKSSPTPAAARSSRRPSDHTKAVLVRDLEQAAEVVNDLAAEHLQLLLPEPHGFLPKVRNAGRDLPRTLDGRAVRRLRRRLEPRAADRRHRAVLERPARRGLRHRDRPWWSSTRAARPGSRPARRRSRTPRASSGTPGPWTPGPARPRSWNRDADGAGRAPACATSIRTSRRSSTSPRA